MSIRKRQMTMSDRVREPSRHKVKRKGRLQTPNRKAVEKIRLAFYELQIRSMSEMAGAGHWGCLKFWCARFSVTWPVGRA